VTWRSVMISRPAKLRREHFSLAIEQEDTAFVPFEDIAVIVLDHREISLTHPVLAACAEYGISLYATGDNHQPNGVFLPFLQHSRSTRIWRLQQNQGKPLAKRTWAAIVRAKVNNQAACLRLSNRAGTDWLESLARQVRSGDPDRVEGQAAAYYFTRLFDRHFQRDDPRWVNSALDYGYAVLRGTIARSLVAHGLHPTLGLFHDSEQNAFNLADDLIEAYRPQVDLHVIRHLRPDKDAELIPADKRDLVALLNTDIRMPRGVMSVLSAIEQCVESLVRVYDGGDETLLELPTLIGLAQHRPDG
jgi:CRISPR-associated protein Cas1